MMPAFRRGPLTAPANSLTPPLETWMSVFHVNLLAHHGGPDCIADCAWPRDGGQGVSTG